MTKKDWQNRTRISRLQAGTYWDTFVYVGKVDDETEKMINAEVLNTDRI